MFYKFEFKSNPKLNVMINKSVGDVHRSMAMQLRGRRICHETGCA